MSEGARWKRRAPRARGLIRAWFWAQPRGPLPRAHLPAPSPPLLLLGSRGRAAPPPAAASGAPCRPEERHGAPAGGGRGQGLSERTCERIQAAAVERSGRVGRRRRAQVRARGWCACGGPIPFPGPGCPVPQQDPQIWVSSITDLPKPRGSVGAESPLPLPVLSSEPPIRGGGSAAGQSPSLGGIP